MLFNNGKSMTDITNDDNVTQGASQEPAQLKAPIEKEVSPVQVVPSISTTTTPSPAHEPSKNTQMSQEEIRQLVQSSIEEAAKKVKEQTEFSQTLSLYPQQEKDLLESMNLTLLQLKTYHEKRSSSVGNTQQDMPQMPYAPNFSHVEQRQTNRPLSSSEAYLVHVAKVPEAVADVKAGRTIDVSKYAHLLPN